MMSTKYVKNLILFSFIILLFGCSKKVDSNITDDFIKKVAVVDAVLPSKYVQYNLYVQTNKDLILVTNVNFLNVLYKEYYQNKFIDFQGFLQATLKQGFKIENKIAVNYEYQTFNKNSNIMKLAINVIIEKHFQHNDNNEERYFFYPKNLSTNDIQTVLYKMFLEGYLISFDDYGGKYNIVKYKDEYPL